jgi:HKD family nuclease
MTELKLRLSNELKLLLTDCEEIWIAVAMVSEAGFNFIQKNVNPSAKQNYLVGIGLPTSPTVLRQLMNLDGNGLFKSRIYHKPNKLFHPKIYIIKTGEKLHVFVGSGNCTDGGLDKNIEISAKIDERNFCEKSLEWYNATNKNARIITEDFLLSYEILFNNRNERIKKDQQELQILFPEEVTSINLERIDFTNQFFKKEHFQAFEGRKPFDRSPQSNQERQKVRNQLYKLHDKVLPKIKEKKWKLTEHYTSDDIVSSAVHGEYTANELQAIWLHYGRDKKEIKTYGKDETPLGYMRLQVIIHKDNVGIWNRIGKDKGSEIDRDNLKQKLRTDEVYRETFFSVINNLPHGYFIELNNHRKYVDEFENEQTLTKFLLSSDFNHYFIIGIELMPDDPRLSTQNIADTVIANFELLLPTYELIKHKLEL